MRSLDAACIARSGGDVVFSNLLFHPHGLRFFASGQVALSRKRFAWRSYHFHRLFPHDRLFWRSVDPLKTKQGRGFLLFPVSFWRLVFAGWWHVAVAAATVVSTAAAGFFAAGLFATGLFAAGLVFLVFIVFAAAFFCAAGYEGWGVDGVLGELLGNADFAHGFDF